MKLIHDRIDVSIFLILIGITFFAIIALSSPALYLTDEWITVNQLHQLNNGSQLLNTEGKYGRLFTGETSLYFTTRGNYLAYSLFLPAVSLPALNFFLLLKDSFRFGALMIWGIVTLISLLLAVNLLSYLGKQNSVRFFSVLIVLFFVFFLCNLLLYTPFPASYIDSPIESAAVIFTNEAFLALMAGILYLFYRNLLETRSLSISAVIITISCSSYFFWSSTAKDHMLIAFLLSCVLYLCTEIIINRSFWSEFLFFFTLGLIAWARPEVGFFILATASIWFILNILMKEQIVSQIGIKYSLNLLFTPFIGVFVGLVPFFLNNFLITKNPFIPTQFLYLQERGTVEGHIVASATSENLISETISNSISLGDKILTFFTPDLSSWAADLSGIFFYPITGAAGLLFVCPLIIITLFSLLLIRCGGSKPFNPTEKQILIFSTLLGLVLFLSYFRGLHGLNTSVGIYPDIRYLSPLYLFMSVISIIILHKLDLLSSKILIRTTSIAVATIPFILIIAMIITEPFGGLLLGYYQFLWVLSYFIVIAGCLTIVLPLKRDFKRILFTLIISVLVTIPLTWQIMLVSLYSVTKMNGYPYWLPIIEYGMKTFLISIQ